MSFLIREITSDDTQWIRSILTEHWGSEVCITKGNKHHVDKLPGFIAETENEKAGLITYNITGNECEIVTLNSLVEKEGVGTALIERVKQTARENNCKRIWLITTNDNTHALRFYQKREFTIKALYTNSMEEARKLKPEIPLFGEDEIPIRDEIELELWLH
jgi:N-acetylglutamate synthase-like GNAT family acetyltransferase